MSKKLLVRWKIVEMDNPALQLRTDSIMPNNIMIQRECPDFPYFTTEQEALECLVSKESKRLLSPLREYQIVRFFRITD